jgi:cell division protein FtsI/penicillin-binding protein 2
MNFGKKTGIDLPGEIPGLLPSDIMDNRTSLYAFAIGQHSLVVSPLQTAVMLSAIAGNGHIFKPQVVKKTIAEKKGKRCLNKDHLFKNYFHLIGINTPFLIDAAPIENVVDEKIKPPHILRTLDYPEPVKATILNALHKVVNGERGIGKIGAIHALNQSSKDRETFFKLRKNLVGKTATAEILYRPCLDRDFKPIIAKHIWFSAASFKEGSTAFNEPELVVIVYLRFGDFGKEAAPLAAKIIEKYRSLQQKH